MKQEDRGRFAEQAALRAKLKRMVVENSRLDMIERYIRELVAETKALMADDLSSDDADPAPGQTFNYDELLVMPIIGPSGSTKTTSILRVAQNLKRDYPGTPVLVVKCRSNTRTMKALQALILEAFGDPQAKEVLARQFADRYEQDIVTRSIRKVARAAGTYVVVLDEAHTPLGTKNKREWAETIASHFKSLVNDGLFAIVVMGTSDAELFFEMSGELNNRKFEGVSLEPVDLRRPDHYHYFYKFVGRIDRQMVRDGIIDEPIGLIDDVRSRAMVYDMSQGISGIVSRILMGALRISQRDGRRVISWDDIKQAFWAWKREQVDENGEPIEIFDPFVSNPRPTTLEIIREMSKPAAA
ncbi:MULTISPECIES: AAA family ATPase [Bradyrhizobium]|uniref:AAA family ATPase n=1 Tax=Bradyrhizobium TaxID=374 RepID=UPI000D730ECC|nr:AAA family ATPase [Bradyrhizobium diazoefficiens]AWO92670.1 AAA family ATPase [Bradyrhizobium diazoefficiens]